MTNIQVYKDIAVENCLGCIHELRKHRRPKEDGTKGWILSVDWKRRSFKMAMIAIAFSGMWLDAYLHQKIFIKHGKNGLNRTKSMKYEEKVQFLGVTDNGIIRMVKDFRLARNDLIHEKAYIDKHEWRVAQTEARKSIRMIKGLIKVLGDR